MITAHDGQNRTGIGMTVTDDAIRRADVIYVGRAIVYGVKRLKRIVRTGVTEDLNLVFLTAGRESEARVKRLKKR